MSSRRKHWVSAGCSATGGAHRRRGEGGDDAHLVLVARKVCYLVAADGAGGATHSDRGSNTAVFAALDWLRVNRLTPSEPGGRRQLERCFRAARRAVEREASELGRDVNDLATTLLVAVVGERGVLAGQIGDGALVVQTRQQIRTVLWDDKPGAANRSDFLTDANCLERLRTVTVRGHVRGAVAVTDGVEGLTIARDGTANDSFYRRLLQGVRERSEWGAGAGLDRLLESSAVRERCDDDLTIAAVALTQEGAQDDHQAATPTNDAHETGDTGSNTAGRASPPTGPRRVSRLPGRPPTAAPARTDGGGRRGGPLPLRPGRGGEDAAPSDGPLGREGGVGREEP